VYAFELKGKQEFIRIELNEVLGFPKVTSYLGGYDVKGVNVKITMYIFANLSMYTFAD